DDELAAEAVDEPEMAAAMAADLLSEADEVAHAARRRIRRSSPTRRRTPKGEETAKRPPSPPPAPAPAPGPETVSTPPNGRGAQRRVEPALPARPSPEVTSKSADQKARNRFLSRLFGG
ncbi:MAG: hypothetical protein AAF449_24670, partial [Myxococcota bacterium]